MGVHFNVRLAEDRLCCLVLVGVRPDGSKELVAVTDGYREDKQSWLDLLQTYSPARPARPRHDRP